MQSPAARLISNPLTTGHGGGHDLHLRDLRVGAGAELKRELVLGYYLRTDLRLGVARALGRPLHGVWSEPGTDQVNVYVSLGESF